MATVASILIKIGANSSELRKELANTKKELETNLGSAAMTASHIAVAGIAGIAASLGALGVKAVQAAGSFQQTQAAMTNMLGSAERAQSLLSDLQSFAAKTPFEFNDVAAATQKFLAFGFTAEQVIPTLTAVGDAAAGVGLGKEGVDRVTLALGQMAAKAKVQSDEMLQLTEAGIPAWQMLADKIGVSIPQAMDMVSKGAVDAQTGLQALVGGMEEKFGGMMEQQSSTITGTWSNMMDGLSQTAIAVGQQISDAFDLPDIFSSLGDSLQDFAKLVKDQGIGEALSQMIPPEVQAAAAALGTTLFTLTIPALESYIMTAKLAAVPLVGSLIPALNNVRTAFITMPTGMAGVNAAMGTMKARAVATGVSLTSFGSGLKGLITSLPAVAARVVTLAAAFGPVGIVITAVGVAIAAFVASGHSLTDFLNVIPGTMDVVQTAGKALAALWGEIGVAIQNLVSAAAPIIAVMATAFTVAIYAIIAVINVLVDILAGIITVVSWVVTAFIALFNMMYEKGSNALSRLGDALSEFADSILPAWASNGLHTIVSFVQKAIGWLQKLIDKIFHTNNALSKAGNKAATQDTESDGSSDDDSGASDVSSGTPAYEQFRTADDDNAAGGGAASLGGGSGSGAAGSLGSGAYNEKKFRETILGYMDENQGRPYDGFECTVYVKSGLGGAGVDTSGLGNEVYEGAETNDRDANAANSSWIQTAIAHGAWHPTDPYGSGGENAKPGDVWVTNNGNHVLVQDTNGYYSAGGYKGVSAHYDQDVRSAFAGSIVGYIDSAQLAGVSGGSGVMSKPSINWDSSNELQAIHAAAAAYGQDAKLMASIAAVESGGGDISAIHMAAGGGMFQINDHQDIRDGNGGRVSIADLYPNYATDTTQNAMAAAAILKDKITDAGGDVWEGVKRYNGGGDADYEQKVHGVYSAFGGSSSAVTDKQAQYYKQMLDQAQQTSKQIDDTYAQSTMTQEELIDRKYQKEYAKLEESKQWNSNYAKDKEKLDTLYAQDRLKAIEADAQKERQIREKAQTMGQELKSDVSPLSTSASQQALAKMEMEYEKTITSIQSKWQGYSNDFAAMTEKQKQVFLKALDDEGVAYEVMENGRLSFAKAIHQQEQAEFEKLMDNETAYFAQAKDIQADLEEAKNQASMEKLEAVLSDSNAIRLNDYEAQKSMMETYQEAFLAAHATTAQMVASLYSTAFSGLSTAMTDFVMGTKSLSSAFTALGKSMIQVVVEFYAKQLAGMLTNNAMAKSQASAATAQTAAQGASMAAALGPAAFFKLILDPGSAALATSLMTAGTAASMSMGMASAAAGMGTSSSGLLVDKQAALSASWSGKKLATGGITTGATIAMIGEGHHDEAVLPLSRDKFEQLGLVNDNQQVNQVSLSVHAIDASSFTDFLRNGGLDTIRQALFDTERNFATEAGVF